MKKSTDIRTLKKLEKPSRYTIPDTRGLHLWIRSSENKYWIFRYTFNGVRFDMSLGSFPLITLSEARQKVLQHKRQLLNNINPIEDRKLHKKLAAEEKQSSIKFNAFASQFIEKISPQWTNSNHEKAWSRSIEIYASPIIGNHALSAIKTEQITKILEPIWHTKHVTASRLRGRLEKIFSAAITTGFHAGPNPAIWTGHLQNLLPNIRNKPRHYKALDYKSLPDFMKKIASSKSVTSLALQFTILTASRAGETLNSKTEEIFGDVWIIPKERMKARLQAHPPQCHLQQHQKDVHRDRSLLWEQLW